MDNITLGAKIATAIITAAGIIGTLIVMNRRFLNDLKKPGSHGR